MGHKEYMERVTMKVMGQLCVCVCVCVCVFGVCVGVCAWACVFGCVWGFLAAKGQSEYPIPVTTVTSKRPHICSLTTRISTLQMKAKIVHKCFF